MISTLFSKKPVNKSNDANFNQSADNKLAVVVSLLSRKGGCEVGEEGRGGEGPGGAATA
jgi:hypothetical protein